MITAWQQVEVRGIFEIPGLSGVRVEALPVFKDPRGSLHELFRADEIPAGFKPLMACSSWSYPGVTTARSLDEIVPLVADRQIFICGGAQIYEQALPLCSDLFLTLVKREVAGGDAFFPPFEDKFELAEEIRDTPDFKILHYRRKGI